MTFKRKIPSMLTMGAASLLAAGAAMAAPPGSFQYGQYHVGDVTAGTVDSGTVACPAATCVDLLSGTGILQRQVTLNTGEQYIQTIVVEDTASTLGANAIVGSSVNLAFTNESFVGVGGGANGDLASQNTVDLIGTPALSTPDNNRVIAQIEDGALVSGGAKAKISQVQALDGGNTSNAKFFFKGNNDETDRYMRMDELMVANATQGITVRKSSGSFTTTGVTGDPATLTLPDGQTVSYNAGDDIGTVWMQLRNFGGAGLPASDDRVLQMQSFTNATTPQFATWNSCNADGLGACNNVQDPGPYDWSAFWDPNGNFGTVPNPMVGTANPAGNNFFPNFPDPATALNVLGQ